jgi:hypothetical protein
MMRLSCGTRSQDRAATVMDRLLHPAKPLAPDADIAERANECDDVSIERAANAFLASRRAKECAERSIALYDRTLTTFGRFCEAHGVVYLKNVTAEHVIGYVQSRAAKWGSRTKIQQLTNLRIFFRWAMAMRWLTEHPAGRSAYLRRNGHADMCGSRSRRNRLRRFWRQWNRFPKFNGSRSAPSSCC